MPFLPFQGNSLPDILQIGDDGLGRISVHKALQNKEELQAALRTPYQFFYKNLAQDLLARLQRTPEFKLIFENIFPLRRASSLVAIYTYFGFLASKRPPVSASSSLSSSSLPLSTLLTSFCKILNQN